MEDFNVLLGQNYNVSSKIQFDKKLGTNVTKTKLSVMNDNGILKDVLIKREYIDKNGFRVISKKQVGTSNISTIKKRETDTSAEIRKTAKRVFKNGDVLIINSKDVYENGKKVKSSGNVYFPKSINMDFVSLIQQFENLDSFAKKMLKKIKNRANL